MNAMKILKYEYTRMVYSGKKMIKKTQTLDTNSMYVIIYPIYYIKNKGP